MTAIDDVLDVVAQLDERDRKVIADLSLLFAAGDWSRIDAVRAAVDAGDLTEVRRLVGVGL